MVLIPDYDVAFTILVAGDPSILSTLAEQITSNFLPAIEEVSKDQAVARFAGMYQSGSAINSSVSFSVDDGPGLKISQRISNGTDFLTSFSNLLGPRVLMPGVEVSVRLYPTGLTSGPANTLYPFTSTSTSTQDVSFRAVFDIVPGPSSLSNATGSEGGASRPFTSPCASWVTFDALLYGRNAFDEFIFQVDSRGNAVSVTQRALRSTLARLL